MSSLWFCTSLAAFIIGYWIGLKRGTSKTIRLINSILAERSGKVVHINKKKLSGEDK